MSGQIHVSPNEFADIVMAFLLDMIRNESNELNNERLEDFLHFLESTGGKMKLTQKFLRMNSETRIKYKRIKDSFYEGRTSRINISETDKIQEESEFDRELCKRIFRKVKEVRFKTSKPITEERLNKIIDYCIKEKEEK